MASLKIKKASQKMGRFTPTKLKPLSSSRNSGAKLAAAYIF
jgi:hypothetical protein